VRQKTLIENQEDKTSGAYSGGKGGPKTENRIIEGGKNCRSKKGLARGIGEQPQNIIWWGKMKKRGGKSRGTM